MLIVTSFPPSEPMQNSVSQKAPIVEFRDLTFIKFQRIIRSILLRNLLAVKLSLIIPVLTGVMLQSYTLYSVLSQDMVFLTINCR